MVKLTEMTIAEASEGLAAREFSAKELTEAHIVAIEDARELNAFIIETPERALQDADASDNRRTKGDAGPLDGIPVAVKDLFCTEGIQTTACSRILNGFVPPYESTVTNKMREAGMVMLGKTNLDEFAMGSSNETSFYGPVKNPWKSINDDEPLVPGGSSGGSASAVAARLCLEAIQNPLGQCSL